MQSPAGEHCAQRIVVIGIALQWCDPFVIRARSKPGPSMVEPDMSNAIYAQVASILLTGSAQTYDAIVWGSDKSKVRQCSLCCLSVIIDKAISQHCIEYCCRPTPSHITSVYSG